MDISKLTVIELKALAFDIQQKIKVDQNNLKIVFEEISKRLSDEQKQMENSSHNANSAVQPPNS